MEGTVSLEQKKDFVKKQGCFSTLTAEENEELAKLFVEQHITTGTTIVTEGDPVDSIYLIVSGTADVRHVTVQDKQLHIDSLATLHPGQAIGLSETGFYSLSGIRTATVVANTNMVLLRLSIAAFHGFALAYSHVSEVMRDMRNSSSAHLEQN